jgi:hypothetical protein
MFEVFSVGLEASPAALLSYVDVPEDICHMTVFEQIFFLCHKNRGPDPDRIRIRQQLGSGSETLLLEHLSKTKDSRVTNVSNIPVSLFQALKHGGGKIRDQEDQHPAQSVQVKSSKSKSIEEMHKKSSLYILNRDSYSLCRLTNRISSEQRGNIELHSRHAQLHTYPDILHPNQRVSSRFLSLPSYVRGESLCIFPFMLLDIGTW